MWVCVFGYVCVFVRESVRARGSLSLSEVSDKSCERERVPSWGRRMGTEAKAKGCANKINGVPFKCSEIYSFSHDSVTTFRMSTHYAPIDARVVQTF